MKHSKVLTFALLAVFVMGVPAVVIAHGGEEAPVRDRVVETRLGREEIQVEARRIVEKERKERASNGERSQEARAAACERLKGALNKKIDKYVANSDKYLGVVNNLFDRVQSFYDEGKLTAPNYDELVATAEAAKVEATASLVTLSELDFELNCDDPDVAGSIASFREAASQTRVLLREYSSSVKDIISALQSVNSNTNQSSDTGTDTSSIQTLTDEGASV